MNRHVQGRDLPAVSQRQLKRHAVKAGPEMTAYLARELGRIATLPTLRELSSKLKKRKPLRLEPSASQMIREDRESR